MLFIYTTITTNGYMKPNFTKEHLERLQKLLMNMLFENKVITSNLGQPFNAVELLHTTSTNTLNRIRRTLNKQINDLNGIHKQVGPEHINTIIRELETSLEVINLIIEYKNTLKYLKTKPTSIKNL